ncbi:MAG: AAA family ATPase [Candidatus Gastranaerophilales bacterium]|nr:AAA family ATPase [Candidatus Gastranaerophilales bacterium]
MNLVTSYDTASKTGMPAVSTSPRIKSSTAGSYVKDSPPDTLEISKENKKQVNKKNIFLAAAAVTAVVCTVAYAALKKKNINQGSIKAAVGNSKAEILNKRNMQDARNSLITKVKEEGVSGANGVCFFGPASEGKTNTIENFLTELKNSGYHIERTPGADEATIEEITGSINNFMNAAAERFEKTKERTVIFVKDLDKIAPDRTVTHQKNAIGSLLKSEKGKQRGFSMVYDAINPKNIDPAVRRPGRVEHLILAEPLETESKEIWLQFKDFVSNFGQKDNMKSFADKADIWVYNKLKALF